MRENLNLAAPRAMVVLDPVKVTVKNYSVDKVSQHVVGAQWALVIN